MNNAVFAKAMENARKRRHIKLVTTDARKKYLVSTPNYHTIKEFSEKLLVIGLKRTRILMNKFVYLALSILEVSKIVMYEFWNDYVKPKYGEKVKLCYMSTDSFIVYIKTKDTYVDISKNVETRFDTSLTSGKHKRVIGLMKDE